MTLKCNLKQLPLSEFSGFQWIPMFFNICFGVRDTKYVCSHVFGLHYPHVLQPEQGPRNHLQVAGIVCMDTPTPCVKAGIASNLEFKSEPLLSNHSLLYGFKKINSLLLYSENSITTISAKQMANVQVLNDTH